MATRSDQEAIAICPTAYFEGGTPTGNFDGAGLSMGTIQFNLGQGTLQPVIKAMHSAGPQTFERILGNDLAAELLRVCDLPHAAAVAWADHHSCGEGKTHVTEPLRTGLINLWKEPGFAAVDRHFCAPYLAAARRNAEFYGILTVRGLSQCFDSAVQGGPDKLGPNAKPEVAADFAAKGGHALPYDQKLVALAEVEAAHVNPRWSHTVLSRRLAIAQGHGTVYGDQVNVDEKFGLSDEVLV